MAQMANAQQGQGAPSAEPQITPEQAADLRQKMAVTGKTIQTLLAEPNSGPKQAIQMIGGIIANNPDHFDANWGASILSDMPDDPSKFRGWLIQHQQMQQQAMQQLNQASPPPQAQQAPQMAAQRQQMPQAPTIDPSMLQAATERRSRL